MNYNLLALRGTTTSLALSASVMLNSFSSLNFGAAWPYLRVL